MIKTKTLILGICSTLVITAVLWTLIGSGNNEHTQKPTATTGGGIVVSTATPTATRLSTPAATPTPTATPEVSATPEAEATATTEQPPAQEATPTPIPQPTAVSSGDMIGIASIGVSAPLVHLEVPFDRVIPTPSGYFEVAIYSFADGAYGAIPGSGSGNIVLAGHVDSAVHGPSIFWDLDKVQIGDTISLMWQDQTYYYSVYDTFLLTGEQDQSWNRALAPTVQESLSIITCEGIFDLTTGEYGHRRVVQAVRHP